MNPLVLAVDIGTSYTKIARYRADPGGGPPCAVEAIRRVPTAGVEPDGTFDVAQFIATLGDHLRGALKPLQSGAAGTGEVVALGITSFLSHVFLDAELLVAGPGLSWSYHPGDETLADVAAALSATSDYAAMNERPVSGELLAPRLLEIARQDPERAGRIHRVVALKDLLRMHLTGAPPATDISVRDYSLLRFRTDAPVQPVLKLLQDAGYSAPAEILPPTLLPATVGGYITAEMAATYNLPPGLPVITGSTDGTAGMYGGGLLDSRTIVMLCGTTDVVMTWKPQAPDSRGIQVSRNAAASGQGEVWGASTGDSGGVRSWMEHLFSRHEHGTHRWQDILPGSAGVRVAPGFHGERAPWNNLSLTGGIAGLKLQHHRGHILRALFESQAYRLRMIIETLKPVIPTPGPAPTEHTMIITGGGNSSVDLTNLRAAILPYPLYQRTDPELSLCGAAMYAIAGIAADPVQRLKELSRSATAAVTPVAVAPDQQYDTLYTQWRHWVTAYYGGLP